MNRDSGKGCGCITAIMVLVFNAVVGAWSIDYILSWFGKDIPFWGDALIAMFVAEMSIPVAVVGWLLRLFGVF